MTLDEHLIDCEQIFLQTEVLEMLPGISPSLLNLLIFTYKIVDPPKDQNYRGRIVIGLREEHVERLKHAHQLYILGRGSYKWSQIAQIIRYIDHPNPGTELNTTIGNYYQNPSPEHFELLTELFNQLPLLNSDQKRNLIERYRDSAEDVHLNANGKLRGHPINFGSSDKRRTNYVKNEQTLGRLFIFFHLYENAPKVINST